MAADMDAALAALLTDRLQVRAPVAMDAYGRRTFRGPFTDAFTDDFGGEWVPCLIQFAEGTVSTQQSLSDRDTEITGQAFVDGWLEVALTDEVIFRSGDRWFRPPLHDIIHYTDEAGSSDHTVLKFGVQR